MGLLQSIKLFARVGDRLPYAGSLVPGGGDDIVGYSAQTEQALRDAYLHPIVCIVVSWLVKQVSSTPLVLLRTLSDEDQERIESHPLLDLLDTPSEFLSGREILAATVRDMMTSPQGQAFWRKERLANGQLGGLTILPSRLVEVKGNRDELITHYEYSVEGIVDPIRYEIDEIVQIRLEPNPNDPKNGLSPLVCVANELMLDVQSQRFIGDALRTGGAPGGLLVPPPDVVMTEELAKAVRDYLHTNFAGARRGEIGVLRAFMNYVGTGLDPRAMAVTDTQETSVSRICGALGVHPVVVGVGVEAGQARVGAATMVFERAAWTDAVQPIQESIGQQIARQLMPEFIDEAELPEYQVEWDRTGVLALQPDMLREAQRWALNVSRGIATRYEAKVGQGMEADDNDQVYLLPSNIIPTPADAPPPLPAPVVDVDGDDDDDEQEGEEAPFAAYYGTPPQYSQASSMHVERAKQQDALVVALDLDRDALESDFTNDLEAVFDDLGKRAQRAFRESSQDTREAALLRNFGFAKQTDQEIDREVSGVLRLLAFTQWEQGVLIPAWDGHMLRTLNLTVGSINGTLGLGVNLPDAVQNRILRAGGLRRGLIDFNTQARDSLFSAIRQGREAGDGVLQIGRRIRDQVPAGPYTNAGSRYRANLIATTETANAQNESARAAYEESEAVVALEIRDGDLDDICLAVAGRTVTFEEAEGIPQLGHPNCTRHFLPVIDDD